MNKIERQKKEAEFFKMNIQKIGAHWLINGKTYSECGFVEKYYFDKFLQYVRSGKQIDFNINT